MAIRIVLCMLLALHAATVCAAHDVAPGFLYAGPLLDVHAPNSEGWSQVDSSSQGMAFARAGKTKGSSFGAQVLIFRPPAFSSADEFVKAIKQAIAQDTSPERFAVIDESYEYDDARGYPCVRAVSLIRDKKAKVTLFKKVTLLLETYSLYCIHPKDKDLGFAVIYSYRGPERISSLRQEAADFIDGVQVPGE